jgi:hypothetical protein
VYTLSLLSHTYASSLSHICLSLEAQELAERLTIRCLCNYDGFLALKLLAKHLKILRSLCELLVHVVLRSVRPHTLVGEGLIHWELKTAYTLCELLVAEALSY